MPDFYIKPYQNIKVRYLVRVIHFQDHFRLVILTSTKNFIANDHANFVPYKYEYIQKLYLLFVTGRAVLEVSKSS